MKDLRNLVSATDFRYLSRKEQRKLRKKNIERLGDGGDWRVVDDPDRVRNRLTRLGLGTVISEAMADVSAAVGAPRLNVLERIIGKKDLLSISFLTKGTAVSRSIGRVVIRSANGTVEGYGTGFLVSPRLLMTNNHVLENSLEARNSLVQFNYLEDLAGQLTAAIEFGLEPNVFFVTSKELDFTLVAVSETNDAGWKLKALGWNPLIRESGKAIVGERVNIIQHPGGGPMQLALRDNEIVDVFDNYMHYVADTQPGSSGSPVLNDEWELAALHHSGVPEVDSRGRILLTTGAPWDGRGSTMHLVSWKANEGIRISRIVQYVDGLSLTDEQNQLFQEAFLPAPRPEDLQFVSDVSEPDERPAPILPGLNLEPDGTVSWYYRINVGPVGLTGIHAPGQSTATVLPAASVPLVKEPDEEPLRYSDAKALIEAESDEGPYYDKEKDQQDRDSYYEGIAEDLSASDLFNALHQLVKDTHTETFSYRTARWKYLYPRVDRHESGNLRNIYSGAILDPVEVLRQEMVLLDENLSEIMKLIEQESFSSEEERLERLDLLEAQLPFNCEHVVPQSWFDKDQPMRADLHHLFACDPGCNSFRSNIPYYQFDPLEEATRTDCGRREGDKFEPEWGRGAVARATLYFLIRYPELVGDKDNEMQSERLKVLKQWHKTYAADLYELHRNARIYEIQGNRNPLIDHPDWIDKIDFSRGFGGGD